MIFLYVLEYFLTAHSWKGIVKNSNLPVSIIFLEKFIASKQKQLKYVIIVKMHIIPAIATIDAQLSFQMENEFVSLCVTYFIFSAP